MNIPEDCKKIIKKSKRRARILMNKYKMMRPKRAVLYLGAGAAMPWGGPSANDLNRLIENNSKYKLSDGTTIGAYLFTQLHEYYGNQDSVNFETIISVLERIFGYYMDKNATGGTSTSKTSYLPHFFEPVELIENIKDYSISKRNPPLINSEGREIGYVLSPKDTNSTPTQEPLDVIDNIYFSNLLRHYLNIISLRVLDYDSYHNVNEHEEANSNFIKFIDYLISKNYHVRIYTTNYDRLFIRILENSYKVFDGFTDDHSDEYSASYPPNLKRILSDYSCLNYYNLHGSIYWDRKLSLDSFRKQFICTPNSSQTYTSYPSYEPGNPGEQLMITNIITGYNKTQRISISPLNAMYNSFGQDCTNSDLMVTIGTSFSDPHLNNTIAFSNKAKCPKWINVIHGNDGYLDTEAGDKFYRYILGIEMTRFTNTKTVNNWIKSEDNQKKIFVSGFQEFLNENAWEFEV